MRQTLAIVHQLMYLTIYMLANETGFLQFFPVATEFGLLPELLTHTHTHTHINRQTSPGGLNSPGGTLNLCWKITNG